MELGDILTLVAVGLIMIIAILVLVYWNMSRKEKEKSSKKPGNTKSVEPGKAKSENQNYSKLSVFDFMDFDNIEDNMIIQDNGERYLMVVKCEGINYDLMSEIEKTAVEQGFIQFLNTLRFPIQLYIQTRTVNISSSIEKYNHRLDSIRQELTAKQNEYNKLLQDGTGNTKTVNNLRMEIARIQNLFDYGKDIIANTEKMSLNKNVLKKQYYIIISYYQAELGVDISDLEEKRNMIFAELYTRAQTIIRTLSACSMKGKVLDSNELAELLYVAYNRDESETFGIERAIAAGYTELYSTAPDVLDKKMEALNNKIAKEALEKAKYVVDQIQTEKERNIAKTEESIDDLISDLAKVIIEENKQYIGKETAKEAIERIDNTKEGEVKADVKEKKRTRKTTSK